MSEFTLINAIFVRRASDGLEVEFLSAHQLRYAKAGLNLVLDRERCIATDGAPDGSYVDFSNQKLSAAQREKIMRDLTEAAIPLRTSFLLGY
jgi:hypothetical protein